MTKNETKNPSAKTRLFIYDGRKSKQTSFPDFFEIKSVDVIGKVADEIFIFAKNETDEEFLFIGSSHDYKFTRVENILGVHSKIVSSEIQIFNEWPGLIIANTITMDDKKEIKDTLISFDSTNSWSSIQVSAHQNEECVKVSLLNIQPNCRLVLRISMDENLGLRSVKKAPFILYGYGNI
ncbi:hypothetical protein RF11_15371 [Thelohanellus kitauei]|uniref:Uncharacterized protein n=1 Tax=Thelohanellus kitauei TaxID=669202 RepID=A0A0C2M7B9_THEKT|nr:hypothetical protein RF11_15371 [Thelohanellus kitauei]